MRGLDKFWHRCLFNHSIATQILHQDGTWNLFYDILLSRETYSASRTARDIEILELQLKEAST